jgi:invasion protein IalB
MRLISVFAAAGFAALISSAALAQGQAPTGQPAGGANPLTENKQVGDWTVRCFAVKNESPCDVYQEEQDQNSHQRVLSLSIAYAPARDQHVIQIAVPLGVSIEKGVVIKTDSYGSPALPYRRCDQLGCYVEMLLSNDQIADLAKSGPQATVNIVADDGKSYALKFSLSGFGGARDEMAALAKVHATAADGAAAPAAAPAKKK